MRTPEQQLTRVSSHDTSERQKSVSTVESLKASSLTSVAMQLARKADVPTRMSPAMRLATLRTTARRIKRGSHLPSVDMDSSESEATSSGRFSR